MTAPAIVWFRHDLRLADNPALHAAIERGSPILPVYIWDEASEGAWAPGGASRWWLHHSLRSLSTGLQALGSDLLLERGDSATVLGRLVDQVKAGALYWNRRYEPAATSRDARVKEHFRQRGMDARSFNGGLLFEPHTIKNRQGGPFQVFTPFWRHCLSQEMTAPLSRPKKPLPRPQAWPSGVRLEDLPLLPRLRWDAGFEAVWKPGEAAARAKLQTFVALRSGSYEAERDVLSLDATSHLSPHLHFGEVGPRQVWAAVQKLSDATGVFPATAGAQKFLTELGWREFAHHLLFHFPHTPVDPLRAGFARFSWRSDPDGTLLKAWQKGRTGYPIVDAGMRQLWQTGWMPNRVRMVVGSFLVKHLRLPWQEGARWFWDTLVDADLANNTLGWQWIAGCGADASPYFRIFAPVLQSRKFDPSGEYLRRWLPELAGLKDDNIAAPWEAPASALKAAGVCLGEDYPCPIVDHRAARNEALAAYRAMRLE